MQTTGTAFARTFDATAREGATAPTSRLGGNGGRRVDHGAGRSWSQASSGDRTSWLPGPPLLLCCGTNRAPTPIEWRGLREGDRREQEPATEAHRQRPLGRPNGLEALYAKRRASPDLADRRVSVDFEMTSEDATWIITDEGAGFDWRQAPDPRVGAGLLAAHGRGISWRASSSMCSSIRVRATSSVRSSVPLTRVPDRIGYI